MSTLKSLERSSQGESENILIISSYEQEELREGRGWAPWMQAME